MKKIENKCFSTKIHLKILTVDNNNIIFVGKYCFYNVSNLKFVNLTNDPINHLHQKFLYFTSSLKLFYIINVALQSISTNTFDNSMIKLIVTDDYHLCCIAPSSTICTAFRPWYISCFDILPLLSMKKIFVSISISILVLNSLSITFQIKTYLSHKTFSIIVVSINANDILCGIYLAFIWITDLLLSGKFHVEEESWRSSFLCFTTFTTIICFTVLTELLLIFLSISRLLVTIHPLNTRFKNKKFVIKSLSFLLCCSLIFSTCITLIFMYTEIKLTTSLCLPFVDPTGSQLIIKLLIWYTVMTQLVTVIGIMVLHIILVVELRKSQKNIEKSKPKQDSNVSLIIQLIMITISNILCWFPAGCVYTSAMFLTTYPVDLFIWVTVIGLPVNSIMIPFIFILSTVRQMIKFKPKVLNAAGNLPAV